MHETRAMRSSLFVLFALTVVPACGSSPETNDDYGAESVVAGTRMCGQDPFAPDAVRGIDVSRHQGTVDFAKVAAASETRLTSTMFNVGGKTRPARAIP